MTETPEVYENDDIIVDLERLFERIQKRLAKAQDDNIKSGLVVITHIEAHAIQLFMRTPEKERTWMRLIAMPAYRADPLPFEQHFTLFGQRVISSSLIGELSPWVL